MGKTQGSDPIDELVPTVEEMAEDDAFIDRNSGAARAAMTDDVEG